MKIVLFHHGGSENHGAEAIIRTAVQLLKETFENGEIGLSTTVLKEDLKIENIDYFHVNDTKKIKKYSLDWFKIVFRNKILNDADYAYRILNKSLFKTIASYDVFISTGGDNYCYGEQPAFYLFDKMVKKAGKKLILWGASIGSDDLSDAKIKDLSLFDLLLIRESYSSQVLLKAGLKNQLVADGAFLLKKENVTLPNNWQDGNTIGFNFSPLVWKKNKASHKAVKTLIQYILDKTSFTIAFIPHVIQPENNDYEVLKVFYDEFRQTSRVLLLPDNLNAMQYKGYISKCRFFIEARTHATIAAYSSLVPTMVLGYSVKSKGIAYDLFGEEKLVLNLEELASAEKLISKFEELLHDEEIIKKQLEIIIPSMRVKGKLPL